MRSVDQLRSVYFATMVSVERMKRQLSDEYDLDCKLDKLTDRTEAQREGNVLLQLATELLPAPVPLSEFLDNLALNHDYPKKTCDEDVREIGYQAKSAALDDFLGQCSPDELTMLAKSGDSIEKRLAEVRTQMQKLQDEERKLLKGEIDEIKPHASNFCTEAWWKDWQ